MEWTKIQEIFRWLILKSAKHVVQGQFELLRHFTILGQENVQNVTPYYTEEQSEYQWKAQNNKMIRDSEKELNYI